MLFGVGLAQGSRADGWKQGRRCRVGRKNFPRRRKEEGMSRSTIPRRLRIVLRNRTVYCAASYQDAEKVSQHRSRIAQRLNVPKRTPRLFARCGLADGLFEHPVTILISALYEKFHRRLVHKLSLRSPLWSGEKLLAQFSCAIDFYLCQNCSSRFAFQETENLQRFPIVHSLDALSSLLCRHTFIHLDELP
jgi:hypothetical protein